MRRGRHDATEVNDAMDCPLYRARHPRKLRAHRDRWIRVEQHLFDKNEITLRDSEVPR